MLPEPCSHTGCRGPARDRESRARPRTCRSLAKGRSPRVTLGAAPLRLRAAPRGCVLPRTGFLSALPQEKAPGPCQPARGAPAGGAEGPGLSGVRSGRRGAARGRGAGTPERGDPFFLEVWERCRPGGQRTVLRRQNSRQLFFIYVEVFLSYELEVWLFKLNLIFSISHMFMR